MFVLGITGGIGTGKSTVSGILQERGLTVLDADKISREVTEEDGRAIPEIAELFGQRAITASGAMNRKYISSIVFSDNRKLDQLSAIIHKYVFEYMDEALEKEREKKTKCVVLDVPIPVNKGFVDHCDQIWVVTCDDRIRLKRLVERGLNEEDAQRRIAVQMTNDEYASLGDHILDNSGSIEELNEQVEKLIKEQLHERGIRI
ncbi:MAG: dephospho-CoA kinase [Clostridiales bacterium]|nr:dephospho-CoA kinase [Clostridiales bacterium]HAW15875.1 dephospho-CoA kinase [Clostridiales bacterium]